MTVKSSVSLSDEHHAFARAQVSDGRFASVSAVIQHGLDLLRQNVEDEMTERAALKALLVERAHGDFVSADEMRQRVAGMAQSGRADAPDAH